MATAIDPNAFLMGSGIASAFNKESVLGSVVGGIITEMEVKQQTDIMDGSPKTWDNGDPQMQLIITIQTDGIAITDDDDGKRRFYVKGSKTSGSKSMHDAVASALKASGVKAIEIGGHLKVKFTGTEPAKTRNLSDSKLWAAKYVPPVIAQVDDFFEDGAKPAATQATQPALSVVPNTPASTTDAGMTPEQIAARNRAYAEQQIGARPVVPAEDDF